MTNRVSNVEIFERALGDILTRVSAFGEEISTRRMAVAYSGGLDSSVLLDLACDYAGRHRIELFAFHVHHGLSLNADQWLAHCAAECERLDVVFDARRITIDSRGKISIEEAARIGRYAALGEMCRAHQVALLLTAHHQDDQAETVMLQLLRGSGLAGLSGMEVVSAAPELLGSREPVLARPLLAMPRSELVDVAAARKVPYIEDESNADVRYARNALRHQVMPLLAHYFPGFQKCMARAAAHVQGGQRLLTELAQMDLAACSDGSSLDTAYLKLLSADRVDNLLRHWLGQYNVRMPSAARLAEMRAQLLNSSQDAKVCVIHANCCIRLHRGKAFLLPKPDGGDAEISPLPFRWNGEVQMHFAPYCGTLYFEPADEGVDAEWLRVQELTIRFRQGGERMKSAANRPTRDIKHHYQERDIPPWERKELPLIVVDDRVLFAAGIGMDCRCFSTKTGPKVRLRWNRDAV
jgi:tRNA(Ile)-lysidine synthase